jgi:hypothetical protein
MSKYWWKKFFKVLAITFRSILPFKGLVFAFRVIFGVNLPLSGQVTVNTKRQNVRVNDQLNRSQKMEENELCENEKPDVFSILKVSI